MDADLLDEKLSKAVERIDSLDESEKVKFVIQYGSSVDSTMRDGSDIDLAIYYDCKDDSEPSRYRFEVIYNLSDDVYDIQIFQQRPLYVRIEVLKGNVVCCRDRNFLILMDSVVSNLCAIASSRLCVLVRQFNAKVQRRRDAKVGAGCPRFSAYARGFPHRPQKTSEPGNFLYDVAWQTIKEFNGFKHRYYDYIGERRIV